MIELLLVLVACGCLGFLAYDQMWLWRKEKQAGEASCPVCGSDNIDGVTKDDLYDIEFLDDDFECLECGLKGDELAGEQQEFVGVLKRLQGMKLKLADVQSDTALWKFMDLDNEDATFNDDDVRQLRKVRSRIGELWEELADLANNRSEVFSLQMEGGDKTLKEYVTSNWDPGDPGTSWRLPGIGLFARWQQARKLCRRFEKHHAEIESTIAEDVERRRKGHW